MISIKEQIKQIPNSPGVYLFRDQVNQILYIGKAKVLSNRVKSYFQNNDKREAKIRLMVPKINNIDWIVVRDEVEAILTEANLIKKHRPKFNVTMKDDKTFPYIQITNEPFPQVLIVRKQNFKKDKNIYFGPYTDIRYLRDTLKVIHKVFQLRTCSYFIDDETIKSKKIKICLDYHINLCGGPCEGLVSQTEYHNMIEQIIMFLKGKNDKIRASIKDNMEKSSNKMDFENAALYRNQLIAIDRFINNQKKIMNDFSDRDVLAVAAEKKYGIGVVMRIRNGLLIGREKFNLVVFDNDNMKNILSEFFFQYYSTTNDLPNEILATSQIFDILTCESWLKKRKGKSVKIRVPKMGVKKDIVDMAKKNANLLLGEIRIKKTKQKEIVSKKLQFLQEDLNMDVPPRRIEAFDISNIQGTNSVASMVCFIAGKPQKKQYRKYNIKTVDGIDDFKSIHEVITRRYTRVLKEKLSLPDLILIDGGKGQLNAATRALNKLGLNYIPVIGLAKRLEEVYRPGIPHPQNIAKNSPGLFLLREIRNEAHRFAITFHRQKRDKNMTKSILLNVPGLGDKRINIIWKTYSNLEELKKSTPDEIHKKTKIPKTVAKTLLNYLK